MSLLMSGLDCHRAGVELREKLAFSRQQVQDCVGWMAAQPGISGCVLLSTCNRTEIYLSGDAELSPWRLLCRWANAPEDALEPYFTTRIGEEAVGHLMQVACGLHSQILGEDQIITQVRIAMELALACGGADPALAALFRRAVTAGKRAKTEVHLRRDSPSMGTQCRDILEKELGTLENKRIVVIGNGQMGRLAAEILYDAGAQVSVTLRTYRHGETVVPRGCGTVPYEERLAALEKADALVSATTSPHYTVTREQLDSLENLPKVAVDLAVPRDIEPSCAQKLKLYDTDDLGTGGPGTPEELSAIRAIAQEELERFRQWQKRQSAAQRGLRFPLFVDLSDKLVVLIGGGTIASRRIASLRLFGCEIKVISPELMCSSEGLTWLEREYIPGDLDGAAIAVAATDNRGVNHAVWEEAQRLGIPVSVADCEKECTFYFPAICTGKNLVAGVVSTGKDHHRTARAAKEIRKILEELE